MILILSGIFMPSGTMLKALSLHESSNYNVILTGMTLFKVGLIINGIVLFILWRKFGKNAKVNFHLHENLPIKNNDIIVGSSFKSSLALVALLVLAAFLRLRGLNSDLWYDEVFTLVEYVRLPFGQLLTTYSQNNHILFSLLSNISVSVFGESPSIIRLPALLFGLASIWALYGLARALTDEREAWLATILMAVSYHHVWFSQNARGYTGLLFWMLLGTWFFIKGLQKSSPLIWIIYAASMALGMFTHLTSIFILISHVIIYFFILLKRTNYFKNILSADPWPVISFILIGLFTFQLYSLVLPQVFNAFQSRVGVGELRVEAWTSPIWALLEVMKGLSISFGAILGGLVALFIFGTGMISYAKSNPIVVWLLLIPVFIGTTTLIISHLHFYPRFFFFLLGIGVLVLVRGTTEAARLFVVFLKKLFSINVSTQKAGTILAGIIIIASLFSLPNNYRYPKQDFSGAFTYIEENRKPSDFVVTVGLAMYPFERYYAPEWEAVETLDELNEIYSHDKPIWLVYTFQDHMESFHPDILSNIFEKFTVVKEFPGTVGGGTIYVYLQDGSRQVKT